MAEVGELEESAQGKNGRTRCIFENGTEADFLLRSLARSLYEDGQTVTETDETINERISLMAGTKMGSIYVLRSLSDDKQITSFTHLHKIGATTRPVDQRLTGAHKHTTFLNAGVEVVAEYQVPASIALKVEKILHDFLAEARLDIWFERNGINIAEAHEWFDVPRQIIDEAVKLIEAETISNYHYDTSKRRIRLT